MKQFVLVRTYSAGVHFGYLEYREGKEVVLSNARRLWRWYGAFTLSEVSQDGVAPHSRISKTVPEITLTEAIEIIPISEKAKESFDACNE
jgi:hypothetical protein